MASASSVLRFEDVSLHFGDAVALDRVSFEMGPGESRIVFGAAGAGKTTLLKVALGLVKPDSGRVFTFGQDATDLPEIKWFDIRSKMGVLFQEGGLFDSMTIAENVAYPLLNRRSADQPDVSQNGNVDQRVRETLRFVELEQTVDKYPSELSGGMRRRVGIARAIVTEPQLVLYDSPTAGLDPITANLIINLILKERDLRNEAAILVTHRYQDGHLMANFRYNPHSGQIERIPEDGAGNNARGNDVKTKFFVMNEGRLVFAGTQAELRASQDPYVRKFVK
jgi:phospholipid/cholesterol/gamma-HCH transport system ATP-binding protein